MPDIDEFIIVMRADDNEALEALRNLDSAAKQSRKSLEGLDKVFVEFRDDLADQDDFTIKIDPTIEGEPLVTPDVNIILNTDDSNVRDTQEVNIDIADTKFSETLDFKSVENKVSKLREEPSTNLVPNLDAIPEDQETKDEDQETTPIVPDGITPAVTIEPTVNIGEQEDDPSENILQTNNNFITNSSSVSDEEPQPPTPPTQLQSEDEQTPPDRDKVIIESLKSMVVELDKELKRPELTPEDTFTLLTARAEANRLSTDFHQESNTATTRTEFLDKQTQDKEAKSFIDDPRVSNSMKDNLTPLEIAQQLSGLDEEEKADNATRNIEDGGVSETDKRTIQRETIQNTQQDNIDNTVTETDRSFEDEPSPLDDDPRVSRSMKENLTPLEIATQLSELDMEDDDDLNVDFAKGESENTAFGINQEQLQRTNEQAQLRQAEEEDESVSIRVSDIISRLSSMNFEIADAFNGPNIMTRQMLEEEIQKIQSDREEQ